MVLVLRVNFMCLHNENVQIEHYLLPTGDSLHPIFFLSLHCLHIQIINANPFKQTADAWPCFVHYNFVMNMKMIYYLPEICRLKCNKPNWAFPWTGAFMLKIRGICEINFLSLVRHSCHAQYLRKMTKILRILHILKWKFDAINHDGCIKCFKLSGPTMIKMVVTDVVDNWSYTLIEQRFVAWLTSQVNARFELQLWWKSNRNVMKTNFHFFALFHFEQIDRTWRNQLRHSLSHISHKRHFSLASICDLQINTSLQTISTWFDWFICLRKKKYTEYTAVYGAKQQPWIRLLFLFSSNAFCSYLN